MQEKYTKKVTHYRLTDRLLGTGSFSQVFLAYTVHRQKLAVKVIPRAQIPDREIPGFYSEVELLCSLKHDNIVELIDFKKSRSNFYLFLEFCQGGNLAEYIQKKRKLPEPEALKILGQILKGLSVMHQFKIMHRDLKPANILLHKGRVKIADFGLATKFSKQNLLRTFAGTPLHMAPEILRGRFYNQSVDIYSAGTVLYEMLYGVMPFDGRDTRALLEAIQKGQLPQDNGVVSERVKNLLREMLKPDPEERIRLNELLDFVCAYENQKVQEKLQEYRKMSRSYTNYLGAPGGLFCRFDFEDSPLSRPYDMDMRLYNKFCRKLSGEAAA